MKREHQKGNPSVSPLGNCASSTSGEQKYSLLKSNWWTKVQLPSWVPTLNYILAWKKTPQNLTLSLQSSLHLKDRKVTWLWFMRSVSSNYASHNSKITMPTPAAPHLQGASLSCCAAGSNPKGGGLPSWCHTRSLHGGHPGIPRNVKAAAVHMWWWCLPPNKGCQPQSAHIPPASCLESALSAGPGPPEGRTENRSSNQHKRKDFYSIGFHPK